MNNNVNSNIQERLQVLNDYIQRTIDALNDLSSGARQVLQGLGVPGIRTDNAQTIGGLGHTGFPINAYGAQVPYGYVPVSNGYGVMQVPTFNWSNAWNNGQSALNHSTYVPGQGWVNVPNHGVPFGGFAVPQQFGAYSQQQGQTIPYGVAPFAHPMNGLNHSSLVQGQLTFVPGQGWVNVPSYAYANPMIGGLNHSAFVQNPSLLGALQQNFGSVTQAGVPTVGGFAHNTVG